MHVVYNWNKWQGRRVPEKLYQGVVLKITFPFARHTAKDRLIICNQNNLSFYTKNCILLVHVPRTKQNKIALLLHFSRSRKKFRTNFCAIVVMENETVWLICFIQYIQTATVGNNRIDWRNKSNLCRYVGDKVRKLQTNRFTHPNESTMLCKT